MTHTRGWRLWRDITIAVLGRASSTRNHYVQLIRAMSRWAVKQGHVLDPPLPPLGGFAALDAACAPYVPFAAARRCVRSTVERP